MKEWYKDWFNSPLYLKVYNHRSSEDAEKLLSLILSFIKPKKNVKILDSACGAGRHALFLAEKGFNTFGFDLSKTLLLEASRKARIQKLNIKYLLTDIRTACFKTKFDIILNIFTSFGYFETDEENFRFFRNAKSFFADMGYIVIDYLNPEFLKNNLVSDSTKNVDGILVKEHRYFENNRINKKITITSGVQVYRFEESVALYDFSALKKEFEKLNYKIEKLWGSYDGGEFDKKKSERIIMVLRPCVT